MNWNGRCKAVTFSYDDGVESDVRLIEIFNEYGLKCTFNLNSAVLGSSERWMYKDRFEVSRLPLDSLQKIYAGHEIAVHGLTHINPLELKTQEAFDAEFLTDRENLTSLFGTEPIGMAYAYGAFDDTTVERLRKAGFLYGRTVWDSMDFAMQSDLLRFRPTCHHDNEYVMKLVDKFLDMPADEKTPQLFYLWGHAYEFDGNDNWDHIKRICEKIAGNSDIFYGTNREVLL